MMSKTRIQAISTNSGQARYRLQCRCGFVKQAEINFGLVSARQAEAYSLLSALDYLRHHLAITKGHAKVENVEVGINNGIITAYLLRERKSRDKLMALTISMIWKALDDYDTWRAYHMPVRPPELDGTPVADFPQGVFPWLYLEIDQREDGFLIKFPPGALAVSAQFRGAFHKFRPRWSEGEGGYILPAGAAKMFWAWLNTVRGTRRKEGGEGTAS